MNRSDIYQNINNINKIVEDYSDMVLRLAYMYVKNISDAEDITQEVFIKFFNSKIEFRDKEHIKAWLITVTKNAAKDNVKSWWKRMTSIFEDNFTVTDNYFGSDVIKQVLDLPLKYRDIIYLYYYEGYSTVEIAKKLSMKEATVRTRLSRGRSLLKIELGGLV
ncbi:sigma-70 family RNA polymerase sigma factor [Clostridium sp. 'deep sea']|uniref:RNA polymerase sigma factor n=1 Tax=Clostridium sp. 'deep sea' TaxID=2779445 RepID=UPI00189676BE|nr:sigma-70 family RNA polymerase sigma factor [Clostridium sp. 'deep sea']QOR35053.1 sigma-70 family RNA polymerase sigma factor [Clostridium sp. 'deep sea']